MSLIPESITSYGYTYTNYVAEDPALSNGRYFSDNIYAYGTGAALPVLYDFAGAYNNIHLDATPHEQHVTLFASPPTLNFSFPGAVYPYNDITGQAVSSANYDFIDYSVPVPVPIKVQVSYAAHIASFSGFNSQFQWEMDAGAYGSNGLRQLALGSIEGSLLSDHLADSFTFVLPANASLQLEGGFTSNVGSTASTRNSYPTATGLVGFLDAGNTGVLTVQELDALGNPIAGNPDLVFLSGTSYLDAVAPPPVGTSVPEPGTQLLVLLALPLIWLLSRRASRTGPIRDLPSAFAAA